MPATKKGRGYMSDAAREAVERWGCALENLVPRVVPKGSVAVTMRKVGEEHFPFLTFDSKETLGKVCDLLFNPKRKLASNMTTFLEHLKSNVSKIHWQVRLKHHSKA